MVKRTRIRRRKNDDGSESDERVKRGNLRRDDFIIPKGNRWIEEGTTATTLEIKGTVL